MKSENNNRDLVLENKLENVQQLNSRIESKIKWKKAIKNNKIID